MSLTPIWETGSTATVPFPKAASAAPNMGNLTAALVKLSWTRLEKKERFKLYGPQVVFVPEGVPD